MSDAPKPGPEKAAEESQLRAVWANPSGWRYWTSVNNTQIGLWYGSAAFGFMLFAGLLGLLIRAQLAVPENDLLSPEMYNQVFTLHGTVMMFLFAVPIFEAVAIFLLPPVLGARAGLCIRRWRPASRRASAQTSGCSASPSSRSPLWRRRSN
jgi:cytochrome c oxidase subunit I+III